jgi:hypothetical protein
MQVGFRTFIVAVVSIVSIAVGSATAADIPPSAPAEAPAAPPPGTPQSSLEGADAACLEWTDGCRVCARADGKKENGFACSNPGIACQPTQGRCTRR